MTRSVEPWGVTTGRTATIPVVPCLHRYRTTASLLHRYPQATHRPSEAAAWKGVSPACVEALTSALAATSRLAMVPLPSLDATYSAVSPACVATSTG